MTYFRPGTPRFLAPQWLSFGAALLLAATPLSAQTPTATTIAATTDYQPLRVDRGTPALQQSLRKLSTRSIIESAFGRIEVTNRPGGGARFLIDLPAI